MLTQTALDHYGSRIKIAHILGISKSAVFQWGEVVPYASAKRLTELSPALTIDPSLYDERLKPRDRQETA